MMRKLWILSASLLSVPNAGHAAPSVFWTFGFAAPHKEVFTGFGEVQTPTRMADAHLKPRPHIDHVLEPETVAPARLVYADLALDLPSIFQGVPPYLATVPVSL